MEIFYTEASQGVKAKRGITLKTSDMGNSTEQQENQMHCLNLTAKQEALCTKDSNSNIVSFSPFGLCASLENSKSNSDINLLRWHLPIKGTYIHGDMAIPIGKPPQCTQCNM